MDAHWQTCLDAFLQSIESISGSVRSRTVYGYTLRAFFSDASKSPDAYSRGDVQRFIDSPSRLKYRLGEPVKAGTKNQRLTVLRSFYKFADTYEIDGEPLLKTKPPTYLNYLKAGSTPIYFSDQEIDRFFAVIPTDTIKGVRDRAIYLTYFWTGRRRSEIARLCWRDIEPAMIVEPDRTRRAGHIYRYIAKGKSRETQIAELPPLAWTAIEHYLQVSGRIKTMKSDSPLFASLRTDQREHAITGGYINIEFKHYAKLAGLDSRASLHSLRHSAARLRRQAGSQIEDIQYFLGHEHIGTTELYLKRIIGVADTGAKLLERRFGAL